MEARITFDPATRRLVVPIAEGEPASYTELNCRTQLVRDQGHRAIALEIELTEFGAEEIRRYVPEIEVLG